MYVPPTRLLPSKLVYMFFRDYTFITWYLLIFILHKLVIMMILLAHFSIHLADKLLDLALTLN